MVIIVMGVSGTGKSTIGQLLARTIGLPFYDADDFHPKTNVDKMKEGIPLSDEDRQPWLEALSKLCKESEKEGLILACSALKESYRVILSQGLETSPALIYLYGDPELIQRRMAQRNHFMPTTLLQSQLEALEIPKASIAIDIKENPETIVKQIVERLGSKKY